MKLILTTKLKVKYNYIWKLNMKVVKLIYNTNCYSDDKINSKNEKKTKRIVE